MAALSCAGSIRTGQISCAGIEHHLDVLFEDALKQPDHAGDQLVDVHHAGRERLPAREGKQLARQLGAADAGLQRGFGQRHRLGVGLHAVLQQVEIADHHREQVVEIVRHAAGQVADRLHLLGLMELLAGVLQLGRAGVDERLDRPGAAGLAPEVENQDRRQREPGQQPDPGTAGPQGGYRRRRVIEGQVPMLAEHIEVPREPDRGLRRQSGAFAAHLRALGRQGVDHRCRFRRILLMRFGDGEMQRFDQLRRVAHGRREQSREVVIADGVAAQMRAPIVDRLGHIGGVIDRPEQQIDQLARIGADRPHRQGRDGSALVARPFHRNAPPLVLAERETQHAPFAVRTLIEQDGEILRAIGQGGALEIRRHIENLVVLEAQRPRPLLQRGNLVARNARSPLQRIHVVEAAAGPRRQPGELVGIERVRNGHRNGDVLDRIAGQPDLRLEVAGAPFGPELQDRPDPLVVRIFRHPERQARQQYARYGDAHRRDPALLPNWGKPHAIPLKLRQLRNLPATLRPI